VHHYQNIQNNVNETYKQTSAKTKKQKKTNNSQNKFGTNVRYIFTANSGQRRSSINLFYN